ncbi:hypothetical protein ACSSS7_006155 [Eimeria intestinalis]
MLFFLWLLSLHPTSLFFQTSAFFLYSSILSIPPRASALRSFSAAWGAPWTSLSAPSPQHPALWAPIKVGALQTRSFSLPSYLSLETASRRLVRTASCNTSHRHLTHYSREGATSVGPRGGPLPLPPANCWPQPRDELSTTAVEARRVFGGPSQGGPPNTPGRDLRLEALRRAKEAEEKMSAFPVALRIPHPELVGGETYRRLGVPSPQTAHHHHHHYHHHHHHQQLKQQQEQQKQQQQQHHQKQQQQEEGPLVSSLCVGTSMIGGNVMQDDEGALRMLCTAYEEYGINFYDVGELDPIPHAPQSHGSGHRGVLRDFFRKYKAAADSSSSSSSSSSRSGKRDEESSLRAEASRIFVSVRLLSGGLGAFDFERFALERQRREAAAAAAARAAAAAGAADPSKVAAAAAAAAEAAAAAVDGDVEGNTRWARASGWWARGPKGHLRLQLTERHLEAAVDAMLQRLGIDCIDLLQLTEPHRYVPRQELGEDTYCWGLERPDAVPIESQLEMLAGLVRKGKVRFLGLSNETAYGIFRWIEAAEELKLPRVIASQHLYNLMHRNEVETAGIPEMAYRLGVPVIAYGALGGGILTGKYLDPERFHSKGPDVRPGQDELESGVGTYRYQIPEDFGFLSFGPSTGRANLWPSTYHTHSNTTSSNISSNTTTATSAATTRAAAASTAASTAAAATSAPNRSYLFSAAISAAAALARAGAAAATATAPAAAIATATATAVVVVAVAAAARVAAATAAIAAVIAAAAAIAAEKLFFCVAGRVDNYWPEDHWPTTNYALNDGVSRQLHELYLHYAAPTMGGPQLLTQLPDSERRAQPPLSQSDFMKWGKQPIWSGGTYWPNWPLPLLPEKVEYLDRKELAVGLSLLLLPLLLPLLLLLLLLLRTHACHELRGAAGALDDPSDEGVINLRLWKERIDEGLPGELLVLLLVLLLLLLSALAAVVDATTVAGGACCCNNCCWCLLLQQLLLAVLVAALAAAAIAVSSAVADASLPAAAAAASAAGEYFAVKEQQLFGWDEHTIDGLTLRNMTETERMQQYHMDWHLCWKGGKVAGDGAARAAATAKLARQQQNPHRSSSKQEQQGRQQSRAAAAEAAAASGVDGSNSSSQDQQQD